MHRTARSLGTSAALLGLLLVLALVAPLAVAEEGAPQTFDTPEAAAEAAIAAAEKNDDGALKALVGAENADLVQSGSDPVVQHDRAEFAKAARARLVLEKDGDDRVVMVIGHNDWPYPVPIVKKDGKWRFDAAAGREEILARRIGDNELEAIAVCDAYAPAQVQYASVDRDGDEVREYAQRLESTAGQHDGLYWEVAEDSEEEVSPFGPLVASFSQYLAGTGESVPVNGYVWKILKGQGPNAPGGAHSYVINGNMIAGFALIGVPAEYMRTGVMTFLVSHHGKVLQKDLGEKSLEIVKGVEVYDPDDTWSEVNAGDDAPDAE